MTEPDVELPFYGPQGAINPSGDLIIENSAWRDYMFEQRAPERRSPYPAVGAEDRQPRQPGDLPGDDGRPGPARAEPAARDDGRHRQPAVLPPLLDEQDQLVPRRDLHRAAPDRTRELPPAGAAPARRADLLHRRDQRPHGPPRSRAHAPGPHGPPRLVPHADEGRPQGHLRSLPRQGLARSGARLARAPRRDRPDHERLLAGDDRADLLDGADERASRGAAGVHVEPPRRRDDGGRVGNGGRRPVRRARDARRRHPRGGPRSRRPCVPAGPRVEPHLDQDARRLARPPPGIREGRALQRVAERAVRRARARARRHGRRDRVLRRELRRRGRRPAVGRRGSRR